MTDVLTYDPVRTLPERPTRRRLNLATASTAVKAGLGLVLLLTIAVPDSEIGAKTFKMHLIVKNLRSHGVH